MKKLIALLSFLLVALPSHAPNAQMLFGITTATTAQSGVAPVFNVYAYSAENAGSAGSTTSSTFSTSTGDLVFVMCRSSEATGNTITATGATISSNVYGTMYSNAYSDNVQMAAAKVTLGNASTAMVCNCTSGSCAYRSMIVLDYSNSPASTTLAGNYGTNAAGTGLTLTLTGISVTGRSLVIACATQASVYSMWTAGTIGGSAATLRGSSSNSLLSSNSDSGCEEYFSPSTLSSASAVITSNVSPGYINGVMTTLAVNY
jgi:hypothetical protein